MGARAVRWFGVAMLCASCSGEGLPNSTVDMAFGADGPTDDAATDLAVIDANVDLALAVDFALNIDLASQDGPPQCTSGCGGACPACGPGKPCTLDGDCTSGHCGANVCTSPTPLTLSFAATPTSPTLPMSPTAIAVADMNGDTEPDLIITGGSDVYVLLGTGGGTFGPPVGAASGGVYAQGLTIADFDGDHVPDVAVVFGGNTTTDVNVLLGNGDGTLTPQTPFGVGGSATITSADFDGDDKIDLAVAQPNQLAIYLGKGDGTFQSAKTMPNPDYIALVARDMNGDKKLDLVGARFDLTGMSNGYVSVLLGNGDGTFGSAKDYPTRGTVAQHLVVEDFTGDGTPDAVATDLTSNDVAFMLGQSGGALSFSSSNSIPSPVDVAAADFDLDGHWDLVVPSVSSTSSVVVLLGQGNGSFTSSKTLSAGPQPSAVAVGDFNADSLPDIAAMNSNGNVVGILLNTSH